MKKGRKTLSIYLLFSLLLILSGCRLDRIDPGKIKGVKWDATFAVPVLNSDLTVYNVLTKIDSNNVVVIDSATRFIALVYDGDVTYSNLDSIVAVPNQSFSQNLTPTPGETVTLSSGGSVSRPGTFSIGPSPSTVKMYRTRMKDGDLVLDITNNFTTNMDVTIDIPNLKQGATSYTRTVMVNAMSTSTVTLDLTSYTFDFTKTGLGYNEIDYTISVAVNGGGATTGNMSINMNFSNFTYKEMYADFGNRTINMSNSSIELKIFGQNSGGVFSLTNPKVYIDVNNSVGIPISLDLTSMRIEQSQSGTEYLGFSPASEAYPTINSPGVVYDSAMTLLTFDKNNVTNITSLVEPTPKYFVYEPIMEINPGGTTDTNFITDESEVRIHGEVELPMEGYAYGYAFGDTVPFDGFEFPEGLQSVEFVTGIDNGFPVDIRFQLFFADSNGVVLDSLYDDFDAPLMASGEVDSDGKVVAPTFTLKNTIYNVDRARGVEGARQLILRAEANSYNSSSASQEIVKLFDYYKVNTRLSMRFQLDMDL